MGLTVGVRGVGFDRYALLSDTFVIVYLLTIIPIPAGSIEFLFTLSAKSMTTWILILLSSQVQVISGSHSEIQHTRTTVVWPWKTLVKGMMPWSA